MSNINDLIQGLKTDLNSHIEHSLKKAKPEIEKYEIYKEAYDLIVNSSIVAKLKKRIRKLERENKRLTKYVLHLTDTTTRPVKSKVREPVIFPEDVDPDPVVFIKIEKEDHTPNIVYELEEIERDVQQVIMEDAVEAVEEVVEEEEVVEVEEEEEVVEVEEEEVVEVEEEEEEVEEEEVVEVEEEEEEVVEEEVEVVEEEVVEVEEYEEEVEEVVAEEEDSEVFEHIIKGVTYYITNELNGTIYNTDDSGEIGDEIGKMVNGSPVFNT